MMGDILSFKRRRKEGVQTPTSNEGTAPNTRGEAVLLTKSVVGTSPPSSAASPLPQRQQTLDQLLRTSGACCKNGGAEKAAHVCAASSSAPHTPMPSAVSQRKKGMSSCKPVAIRETPASVRNGVVLALREVQRPELAFLQKALTFYPQQLFDKNAPSQPILAYKMDSDTISIPRMLGWKYYPHARDELVDGEALSQGLHFTARLLPLQCEVAQSAMDKVVKAPHGVVLTLPCGFGKTVLALYMAHALGRRTLVVVHKEFLLSQWKERIDAFLPGASVGILQGKREEVDNDFVLAMVQTIACREYPSEFFDGFGTFVCDEVHHYASKMFSLVFFNNRIRHVIGLSATPRRKDGLTELVHHYVGDFAANIEDGISATARSCRILRVAFGSGKRRVDDMTACAVQKLKGGLVLDERRNRMITTLVGALARAGRRIIVLSERVGHLEALVRDFEALGLSRTCSLYIGATKAKDRVRAAEAHVIFATLSLAAEGLDIAALDTLVLATPCGDVVQAVGRILRESDSKQSPLVVDIVDDACAAFERMAAARVSYYRRCDYPITESSEDCDVQALLGLAP